MLDLAAIKARAAARLAESAEPAAKVANPANRLMVADAPTAISQLATLASSDDTDRNADAWCRPHSEAMNTAELARMVSRLHQFARRGIDEAQAGRLADRLMLLDRAASGL